MKYYIKHKRERALHHIFQTLRRELKILAQWSIFDDMFGNVMKHYLICLIYLLNQN